MISKPNVIIIGAGASGLMCALEAGKRGRKVLVLDHTKKPGNKILVSGGGSCNFTNYYVEAENFICSNPHFCKSAISRYTQWDFIEFINKHQIAFHEREHGQLFCDGKARQIVDALMQECKQAGVTFEFGCEIESITQCTSATLSDLGASFSVKSTNKEYGCESLVVATGGLSIPTIGASPFGYKIAEQFEIPVIPPRAGLVPFTLHKEDKERLAELSGIAVDVQVSCGDTSVTCAESSRSALSNPTFRENILFTHRGLSGPAILQISSYWSPGELIEINLLPDHDLDMFLKDIKQQGIKKIVRNVLGEMLPQRLVEKLLDGGFAAKGLQDLSARDIKLIADKFNCWKIKPNGTEGYRTAEVTVGGVDCDHVSSKTMESKLVKGLYFIGEVLDVTGWLGGYNLQWAWSSGWCAGQVV